MKADKNVSYPYSELTYQVIGLMYETHNKLGHLHQEKHYQRALDLLLKRAKLNYEKEYPVAISIDGQKVGYYKLDFVIEKKVVLETKTTLVSLKQYHHQILSYMRELQIQVGLLANFRKPLLEIKRLILPQRYLLKSAYHQL